MPNGSLDVGRIRLVGMTFEGIIGDLPHERDTPQPIEIDVEIEIDLTDVAESDELADTLDYRWVYAQIGNLVEQTREVKPRLLEFFLARIAEALLAPPRVSAVTVRGRKPSVELGGPTEKVEAEVRYVSTPG